MAFTFTVSSAVPVGNFKMVSGTFTSATGDNTMTLDATTHGLNYIADYHIDLSGVGVFPPKVTISSGTITGVWDDTLGYSGNWMVKGR